MIHSCCGGKTATKGEELGTRSALPTVALRHRGLIQFLSASSNFDQGAPETLIFNFTKEKIHFCGFWSRLCLWTPTCVFKEQHQTKQEYEEIFLSTTMMWRLLLPAGILITYSSHLDLVVQCSLLHMLHIATFCYTLLHFVTHCYTLLHIATFCYTLQQEWLSFDFTELKCLVLCS